MNSNVAIRASASVGDAYDNAMCESYFATLECELLDRRRFKTHIEGRTSASRQRWPNSDHGQPGDRGRSGCQP
jgi:hypothetical protein